MNYIMRKRILFCCIVFYSAVLVLHAQCDYGLRFTDTVHLQAKLVTVNFPNVIGAPYCYFIVSGEDEINDVVNRYLTKSPQKKEQLYLISHLSNNQFIAIRRIIEDSLCKKLSVQKVSQLLLSCDIAPSIPTEIVRDSAETQMGELIYRGTKKSESTKSLLTLTDENCISKEILKDISRLWGREKAPAPLYCEICIASFDSWGVILEMEGGCYDFFYSNDYESQHFNETLKLFIPLSPINQ